MWGGPVPILQIQPLHGPNRKHSSSVDVGDVVSRVPLQWHCPPGPDRVATPLPAALLLLRDVTAVAVTVLFTEPLPSDGRVPCSAVPPFRCPVTISVVRWLCHKYTFVQFIAVPV
jgi:hypothetical protein